MVLSPTPSSPPAPSTPQEASKAVLSQRATFVAMGRAFMLRMIAHLMADKDLLAAIAFDPHQRLNGTAHKTLRAKVRLVKRMLRAWLWVQGKLLSQADPDFYTRARLGRPRNRPKCDQADRRTLSATDQVVTEPQSLNQINLNSISNKPKYTPKTKPTSPLYAQGFRGRATLWAMPRTPKPKPPAERPMLPEVRAWLFADRDIEPVFQPTSKTAKTPPTQTLTRHERAPKAGQIYVDLERLAAVIDAPSKAVHRVARKIMCLPASPAKPVTYPRPRAIERPHPPAQAVLKRLAVPNDEMDWWTALKQDGLA